MVITNEEIVKRVSDALGIDISRRSRKRPYVYGRCIYYKIAKEFYPGRSLAYIGEAVGVDHATIIHCLRNIFPVIEKFEPELLEVYLNLYRQMEFETGQGNSIPATHEAAKKEIATLRYRLKIAEERANVAVKLESFNDLLLRIPDDKVDIVKLRLDAMIKML